MMVTLKQNLAYIGTHKELIVLNILKYICHVTILLKILNHWPINGRFKKRNRAIGQLHDNVILLQLPESFSVLFSYAN